MRVRGRVLRCVLLLGIASGLLVPQAARAGDEIIVVHQPPPVLAAGMDATIAGAIVNGCELPYLAVPFVGQPVYCSEMFVELTYVVPCAAEAGCAKVLRQELEWSPGHPFAFTVPGGDVSGPHFEYRIDASQVRCNVRGWPFPVPTTECRRSEASSGPHRVAVSS